MLDPSMLLVSLDSALMAGIEIDAKLHQVLATRSDPNHLRPLLNRITGDSTAEQRLLVYQAIRDARVLPDDAGFYLVAHAFDILADAHIYAVQDSDPLFQRFHSRIRDLRAHDQLGDDQDWPVGHEPAECHDLATAWTWRAEGLHAASMRAHGDHEMAHLYLHDRADYQRRYDGGSAFFHGESPLDGPSQFLEVAASGEHRAGRSSWGLLSDRLSSCFRKVRPR